MPRQDKFFDAVDPAFEQLRDGTRKQYESKWTQIVNGASKDFQHGLGEVPWVVSVIRSETDDGKNPVDTTSTVTVTKSVTVINVTNGFGANRYFKVRAM